MGAGLSIRIREIRNGGAVIFDCRPEDRADGARKRGRLLAGHGVAAALWMQSRVEQRFTRVNVA